MEEASFSLVGHIAANYFCTYVIVWFVLVARKTTRKDGRFKSGYNPEGFGTLHAIKAVIGATLKAFVVAIPWTVLSSIINLAGIISDNL